MSAAVSGASSEAAAGVADWGAPRAPPGVDASAAVDAWAAGGSVTEAAPSTAKPKKGDGKAGMYMASFNLSNAVRMIGGESGGGGAHRWRGREAARRRRAASPPPGSRRSLRRASSSPPLRLPPRPAAPPLSPPRLPPQILGAGVGGMPYALKEAGFYSGLILMCLVAASSDFSVRMLIKLAQRVGKKHYEQLVQSQFGRAGYISVCAAMGIFAYGAMCAYLIGIGASSRAALAAAAVIACRHRAKALFVRAARDAASPPPPPPARPQATPSPSSSPT